MTTAALAGSATVAFFTIPYDSPASSNAAGSEVGRTLPLIVRSTGNVVYQRRTLFTLPHTAKTPSSMKRVAPSFTQIQVCCLEMGYQTLPASVVVQMNGAPDIVFVSPALLHVVPVAIVALRTSLSSLPQLVIPAVRVAPTKRSDAMRKVSRRGEWASLELNMVLL